MRLCLPEVWKIRTAGILAGNADAVAVRRSPRSDFLPWAVDRYMLGQRAVFILVSGLANPDAFAVAPGFESVNLKASVRQFVN